MLSRQVRRRHFRNHRLLSGLGGVGKTQVAVEYAYQHHQDYQAVFWALADTRESLVSAYIAIAELLNLPEKDEQDQTIIIKAVLHWLTTHTEWLLVLDNADDLAIVREFVPPVFGGRILLTTRAQAIGRLAHSIEIDTMPTDIGALFLLRRALLVPPDASLQYTTADVATARKICKELGGLPLALDQAGAFIEEAQCSLLEYLQRYRTRRAHLLQRRGGLVVDHPEPVATTWSLSFERVWFVAFRIASHNICLCNGFTCHTLQRIVVVSNVSWPAFSPPLETTERGTRWKDRGRY